MVSQLLKDIVENAGDKPNLTTNSASYDRFVTLSYQDKQIRYVIFFNDLTQVFFRSTDGIWILVITLYQRLIKVCSELVLFGYIYVHLQGMSA